MSRGNIPALETDVGETECARSRPAGLLSCLSSGPPGSPEASLPHFTHRVRFTKFYRVLEIAHRSSNKSALETLPSTLALGTHVDLDVEEAFSPEPAALLALQMLYALSIPQ